MKKMIQFCVFLIIFSSSEAMAQGSFTIVNHSGHDLTATIFYPGSNSIPFFPGSGGTNKGSVLIKNGSNFTGSSNASTFGYSIGPYYFIYKVGGDFDFGPFVDLHKIISEKFSRDYMSQNIDYYYYVYGPVNTPSNVIVQNDRGTTNCGLDSNLKAYCDFWVNFTINSVSISLPSLPS